MVALFAIYDTMQFVKPDVSTILRRAGGVEPVECCWPPGGRWASATRCPTPGYWCTSRTRGDAGQWVDIEQGRSSSSPTLRPADVRDAWPTHTGQPVERIARDADRDSLILRAEAAVEYAAWSTRCSTAARLEVVPGAARGRGGVLGRHPGQPALRSLGQHRAGPHRCEADQVPVRDARARARAPERRPSGRARRLRLRHRHRHRHRHRLRGRRGPGPARPPSGGDTASGLSSPAGRGGRLRPGRTPPSPRQLVQRPGPDEGDGAAGDECHHACEPLLGGEQQRPERQPGRDRGPGSLGRSEEQGERHPQGEPSFRTVGRTVDHDVGRRPGQRHRRNQGGPGQGNDVGNGGRATGGYGPHRDRQRGRTADAHDREPDSTWHQRGQQTGGPRRVAPPPRRSTAPARRRRPAPRRPAARRGTRRPTTPAAAATPRPPLPHPECWCVMVAIATITHQHGGQGGRRIARMSEPRGDVGDEVAARVDALRAEIDEHNRRYHARRRPRSPTPTTTPWSASCASSRRVPRAGHARLADPAGRRRRRRRCSPRSQHRVPMMSLDNAFDLDELLAWGERLERRPRAATRQSTTCAS